MYIAAGLQPSKMMRNVSVQMLNWRRFVEVNEWPCLPHEKACELWMTKSLLPRF